MTVYFVSFYVGVKSSFELA